MSELSFLLVNNPGLANEMTLDQSTSDQTFIGRTVSAASVRELVANFQFEGSTVSIGTVVQESGQTVNDFTNPVVYKVTNSSGDEQLYTVDITRFTGLPIIHLSTNNYVSIDSKDDYVPGSVTVDGGRGAPSSNSLAMKIRGRGNSTWMHPKKPFQMKLNDKAEMLGMPEDKKWLFIAEYSDKTLLRNTITFEMGYMSHLAWTPQRRFAEVFINEEYNGTYNVTQKVEESDNRVALGDTGYLLEIDQLERLDPDDVYFRTSEFLINIKEPSIDWNDAEHTYITDLVNDFETALFSANFDAVDIGYANYIDMDSFIDWYLINEITKNVDSVSWSSIYLNVIPGEKIHMGPLWDFDLAFGNVDYAESQYPEGWWVRYNPWYERLFQDPAFVAKVKLRFAYFIENETLILNKIDGYAEKLRWAHQENDAKWQTLGLYVWPNPVVFDTYQEEVDHMKSWYSARMDWLEIALNNL
jgi:spore coat protein CotH|tara:strand:- start:4570 stop:5979 length:1410 start_codon:yes stop_codon:yes gene_type:complete